MKKFITYTIGLFFFMSYTQNFKIEEIELIDDILTDNLKAFISKTLSQKPQFRDSGYIELRLEYTNNYAKEKEVKTKYRIKDQYFEPSKSFFPKYFCYLNNKLILIYSPFDKIFKKFNNKKNRRKLSKIIHPYLEKTERIKAYDNNGNLIIDDKNFKNETYNIHGGITLIIKANGEFTIEENYESINSN